MFAARAEVFHAARKWLIDNRERWLDTICAETGKTRDDGQVEVSVAAQSFAFWAKMAPVYLAEDRVKSSAVLVTTPARERSGPPAATTRCGPRPVGCRGKY